MILVLIQQFVGFILYFNFSFLMAATDERYAFRVEWFDKIADLTRVYHLFHYVSDGTLEMYI